MSLPLLSGHQEYLVDDTPALRQEIERLVGKLRQTEGALKQAQDEARVQMMAISSLRKQLSPLYRALQGVFGELEQFDVALDEMSVEQRSQGNSKWNAIKQRLAPRLQDAIDIFLAQGSMTSSALAAALKTSNSNCSTNIVGPLTRQGLVVRNGRELRLKEI